MLVRWFNDQQVLLLNCISTRLGGRIGHGPRKLHFRADSGFILLVDGAV